MALKSPVRSYKPARAAKKKSTKDVQGRLTTEKWHKEAMKEKGFRFCSQCGALYYDGHWHTAPALSAFLKKNANLSPKNTELCLACQSVTQGKKTGMVGFEGELILEGIDHLEEKAQILATIRNFSRQASARNPENRIIEIRDREEKVVITTTDNQLAVNLGKAVDEAFKGGKLSIKWSKGDLPARAIWTRHK